MKKVSIQTAFVEAIEQTDEGLARYQNQMMKWAKYIEREIGTQHKLPVKAKAYELTGCALKEPDDCERVIGFILGDYEDECNLQYRNINTPVIYVDRVQDTKADTGYVDYIWMPANTTWFSPVYWEIYGDTINFVNDMTGKTVTMIYNRIDTDKQGNWLVNQSHISAIAMYIAYRYSKKYRWRAFRSQKMLRQGDLAMISSLEREYSQAVRNARALDNQETPYEEEQY